MLEKINDLSAVTAFVSTVLAVIATIAIGTGIVSSNAAVIGTLVFAGVSVASAALWGGTTARQNILANRETAH